MRPVTMMSSFLLLMVLTIGCRGNRFYANDASFNEMMDTAKANMVQSTPDLLVIRKMIFSGMSYFLFNLVQQKSSESYDIQFDRFLNQSIQEFNENPVGHGTMLATVLGNVQFLATEPQRLLHQSCDKSATDDTCAIALKENLHKVVAVAPNFSNNMDLYNTVMADVVVESNWVQQLLQHTSQMQNFDQLISYLRQAKHAMITNVNIFRRWVELFKPQPQCGTFKSM